MTDVLYLAGPYTRPDPIVNVNGACRVATIIIEQTEWVPMVPHLTMLWHAITPRSIGFWYALDLIHLAHCDAIVRLPGASIGADHEMGHAESIGLTVVSFYDLPLDAQRIWTRRGA